MCASKLAARLEDHLGDAPWMPMRKRMRRYAGWSPSYTGTCCCTFTAHRSVDAVEHNQQGIATGLHHPAAVLANLWVDQRASHCAQTAQRAGIFRRV